MTDEHAMISEIFKQAAAVVEKAELSAELRPVAFTKAVEMLTASGSDAVKSLPSGGPPPLPDGDVLQRIAAKFQVDRDLVDETYELDAEGSLTLSIAKSRLELGKAGATKQIVALIAAGRQAAGIETTTSNGIVRAEVEGYGKYDSPNFAATVKELDDIFSFPGTGRDWHLKVRKAAFGDVGDLLKKIHGQAQS